jgi:Tfp pilus assembly protein PilF
LEQVCRVETASDAEVARLKRLFERNPTSTIFARLADAYLDLGDAEAAVSVCRRGLKYRPSYITGHLVLGRAFVEIEDTRGAEDEFQKVLRLEPDIPAAIQHLATIAERSGDSERARLLWDRLRVLNPFHPVFREVTAVSDKTCRSGPEFVSIQKTTHPERDDTEVESGEFPFVSLTLARLYESQGHPGLAERVVRLVSPVEPDDISGRPVDQAAK